MENTDAGHMQLRDLVAAANAFADEAGQLLNVGKPAEIEAGDWAARMLQILLAEATINYRAALVLIDNAELAWASEVLLRPMLEAFAHVRFIASGPGRRLADGSRSTPRTRALCLELGIAKQSRDNLNSTDPSFVSVEARRSVEDGMPDIVSEHAAAGCQCNGRSRTGVVPTLEAFTTETGKPWPKALWIRASGAAHAVNPHRTHRAGADPGLTEIRVAASLLERACFLDWTFVTYASILDGVAAVDNPAVLERLRGLAESRVLAGLRSLLAELQA